MKFTVAFFLYLISLIGSHCLAQHKDITIDAGIMTAHRQGSLMGGGAAFVDFENDGWLDIIMTGGDGPDRLFRNKGDGTFEDLSHLLPHNFGKTANTSSVIFGDLDNDGCEDLFFTTFDSPSPNVLLQNNCDGTFTEVTGSANINESSTSIGAALMDIDLDGLLDIYVINYIDSLIYIRDESDKVIGFDHECSTHLLYRNLGSMKFEETSERWQAKGSGCALAVAPVEFTDSDRGLYIANDFGEFLTPNQFLHWNKDANVFEEVSAERGLDAAVFGMGIAVGDYDQDLDLDLYVTNLGKNELLVNHDGYFTDRALEMGVDDTYADSNRLATGWGTFFYDFDNDTHLDLFVANGFVPAAEFIGTALVDPCRLFQNSGGNFRDVTAVQGINLPQINRGSIYGDIDNDGDLDLLVVNTIFGGLVDQNSSSKLLENKMDEGRHYIDLKLEGVTNNRNGFGSKVYLSHSGKIFLNYLLSGGTHASQNTSLVHFGLGSQQQIDSLVVKWPNGLVDRFYDLPVDQRILVREGAQDIDILGCMEVESPNYEPLATLNSGCLSPETTSTQQLVNRDFRVYPTLFSDQITVQSIQKIFDSIITIRDLTGKCLMSQTLSLTHSGIETITLNLAPGPYLLQVHGSDGNLIHNELIVSLR